MPRRLQSSLRYAILLSMAGVPVIPAAVSRAQVASARQVVFVDLEGRTRALEEYLTAGPVYMTFWALWCTPCKQELIALRSVVREHPEAGFTILAVNQDTPRSLAKVKAYVSAQKLPFPVALDPDGRIFRRFGGQGLPLGVLLDRTGAVVATRTGYLPGDEKEIERTILSLLGKDE